MGHLFATGSGDGLILWSGPTCSQPKRPSGVGSGGPWRRKLAQPGPQPIQPWRRELISRLSPACCHSFSPPLPPSFLHSLPAQPQSTRAKRRARAGAKPLEAQGGACERGLTSAGPRCPQLLTPPGA